MTVYGRVGFAIETMEVRSQVGEKGEWEDVNGRGIDGKQLVQVDQAAVRNAPKAVSR